MLQVDDVAAEGKAAAKPNISSMMLKKEIKNKTVAAGGFALNVTNNYYNKGGDTMVQNKSDNRVSSQNSTNAVVFGGGDGRFGGGVCFSEWRYVIKKGTPKSSQKRLGGCYYHGDCFIKLSLSNTQVLFQERFLRKDLIGNRLLDQVH